ncbi:MAG: class B sortase [Clostridiales bacterium]|nr:class B sortase [Clostridiales bacterium]
MTTAKQENKTAKRKRGGKLTFVLIFLCAAVAAVSAYQLISYYWANHEAESDFNSLRPPVAAQTNTKDPTDPSSFKARLPYYEKLKSENPDFAAWLTVPGTNIDYPVMQTLKNQNYYIDKDFQKKYSMNGSIFLSELSDVAATPPSDVVTVYGHHMKTGAMFGHLEDLTKPENFMKATTVILDTLQGRYVYRIYGLYRTPVDTGLPTEFKYWNVSNFPDEQTFDTYMAQTKAKLEIKNDAAAPVFGDKLILLSTCEYTQKNGRLVLVGVLENQPSA